MNSRDVPIVGGCQHGGFVARLAGAFAVAGLVVPWLTVPTDGGELNALAFVQVLGARFVTNVF